MPGALLKKELPQRQRVGLAVGVPALDVASAITELAVGEALVSLLDDKGRPGITERVYVLPPSSQIGPVSATQRQQLLAESIVAGVYEKAVDRASAFEALKGRSVASQESAAAGGATNGTPGGSAQAPAERGWMDSLGDMLGGGQRRSRASVGEQILKSAASQIGREVGRQLIRGVLGGLIGSSRR